MYIIYSKALPGKADGKLSQGDHEDVLKLIDEGVGDVHCVVLAAEDFQPKNISKCPYIIRALLRDSDKMSPEVAADVLNCGRDIAKRCAKMIMEGHHVLVTCWAGLNRSGLISALTLVELGFSHKDAIEIVRKGRGPYALCNKQFESILLSLDNEEEAYA